MSSASLVHLLKASVQTGPDSEALVFQDQRLTYAHLWEQVESVRQFLLDQGVQPGDRVALLLENSPEYVVAYYAALAAQATVIGLNTATKSRDLSNWIHHSDAVWLIAQAQHAELVEIARQNPQLKLLLTGKLPADSVITRYHAWQNAVSTPVKSSWSGEMNPQHLAAIIYTSGTTGSPKGVMLTHQNLVSNVQSILEYLRLRASDRILNVLPFYYSYGNSVLHTHLAAGASIVLENSLMYPKKVLETMVKERVSGFSGVPSTFALLLGRTKLSEYDLSSLRYVTQAGGPMPPAKIREFREILPAVDFIVMYGQTEATARLTYLPATMLEQKLGSVGVPIPGVMIEVRNQHGDVTAVGETGEILASGKNISAGYWKDAARTAEVFVDGWLHTGDLAYRDADGYLYIQGRSSDMIKTGAHRVSPKEIEEVINELPGVEETAVIGIEDELLGQVIKAFIVPRAGHALEKRQVQLHCKNNLANYKVPRDIEFINELPKTASGKIQRFKLQ